MNMINAIYEASTQCVHIKNLKGLRKIQGESQTNFWYRFGVTQSRGSRFEKGESIPAPVAILIQLYLEKKVSDGDLLSAARDSVESRVMDRTIDTAMTEAR